VNSYYHIFAVEYLSGRLADDPVCHSCPSSPILLYSFIAGSSIALQAATTTSSLLNSSLAGSLTTLAASLLQLFGAPESYHYILAIE